LARSECSRNYFFFVFRPKVKRAGPPLKNMEFVILGKTARPKDELKGEIKRLGGKVVRNIHNKLAAVISTTGKREDRFNIYTSF
jgi:NAD-dependent DNA ligase